MDVVTLLIAILALVVAIIAFHRTGGIKDLRRQVEGLSAKSEGVRDRTANILERLERFVRGKEKASPGDEKENEKPKE